ncbi:hypothetical protein GCM10010149_88240 [Nonomuraea roseoviolacea subsp. roseoviolacea]|uniref:hypothetical protein n=1 Tax=Nonomuraea roseoviolacea TaxID=103837 RepID=UPI0031CDF972
MSVTVVAVVAVTKAVEDTLAGLGLLDSPLSTTQRALMRTNVTAALAEAERQAELDEALRKVVEVIWYADEWAHIVDLARQLDEYPEAELPDECTASDARWEFLARYLGGAVVSEFEKMIPAEVVVDGYALLHAVMAAIAEENGS